MLVLSSEQESGRWLPLRIGTAPHAGILHGATRAVANPNGVTGLR